MEDDPELSMTPKQRYDRYTANKYREIAKQRETASRIMIRARSRGWDVDTQYVMDNLPWFTAWDAGLIAPGHLINRLALKRMSRSDYAEWTRQMAIQKAVMLDTVRTTAHNIPKATPFVAGYITGSGVVPWSETEWAMFPGSVHVRIDQSPSDNPDPWSFDALDMETNALTAGEVAQQVKRRVDVGAQWTIVYATRANLALATKAIEALGEHYWNGHVLYWLADWNLDESQAAALIGTFVEGATCVAVQWASPTSNPHTPTPGGSLVLAQSNVDISVIDASWRPSVKVSTPAPPPPVTKTEHGVLVTDDGKGNLTEKNVSSTDDIHWQ